MYIYTHTHTHTHTYIYIYIYIYILVFTNTPVRYFSSGATESDDGSDLCVGLRQRALQLDKVRLKIILFCCDGQRAVVSQLDHHQR